MRHFLRLDQIERSDLEHIMGLADAYDRGQGPRFDGAATLFFPPGSIRTRASFERGLATMGLQPIVFPPETLDKPEAHEDVAGYLAQFCDLVVVRASMSILEGLAAKDHLPVVNAMTDVNHPCEALSDLWALRKMGRNIHELRYAIVGVGDSNVIQAWFEAGRAFGLDMVHVCPTGHELPGVEHVDDILVGVDGADVIATDPPGPHTEIMAPYRITSAVLAAASTDVLLDPCPPFQRGREVSTDAVASSHFVGYGFKRALLPVQQAVVAWAMGA